MSQIFSQPIQGEIEVTDITQSSERPQGDNTAFNFKGEQPISIYESINGRTYAEDYFGVSDFIKMNEGNESENLSSKAKSIDDYIQEQIIIRGLKSDKKSYSKIADQLLSYLNIENESSDKITALFNYISKKNVTTNSI